MKYIIMCGGEYRGWETPKQLIQICREPVVARTIRLLRDAGVDDIAISSNNSAFEQFGVPVLKHNNSYHFNKMDDIEGYWVDGFYPTDEPTTYLFGDVVFSPEAIKTIVEAETDDVAFFASAPPYSEKYFKPYPEPFGFKVVNTKRFRQGIEDCKRNAANGMFWRHPIAWELWTSINNGELKRRPDVYKLNYIIINDYTCDIDTKYDVERFEVLMNDEV